MNNRDISVFAQTTSATQASFKDTQPQLRHRPGQLFSAMPQARALRRDQIKAHRNNGIPPSLSRQSRQDTDNRPQQPPERPLNEPGYTRSNLRSPYDSEEKSAGSEHVSGPSGPFSKRPSGRYSAARAPWRATTTAPPSHAMHLDSATHIQSTSHASRPVSAPADHPPPQANAGIRDSRAMLCQVLNQRAPRPL